MTPLRLGFIPLIDCAVLAVAEARGYFRRHGLAVELSREASWATIRDKLAVGALDGAQMLAGMPLAAAAGIDPLAVPTLTAFSLDLNGNAITVSHALWERMQAADAAATAQRPVTAAALKQVIAADRGAGRAPLRFAMVYPFATHNYELRYWLAAAGIDPDRDVQLSVVPPPRMVDALARGAIDGFCVGEPWSSLAVQRALGCIVIAKVELWHNSPEKVFAVPRAFAEREPRRHQALLEALLEAAIWTDTHREEVAQLLADPRYVGAPAALLAGSLTGRVVLRPGEPPVDLPDFHVFHRYAANFPWISHGVWLLQQMRRWGQIDDRLDVSAIAREVYRPDLYRAAAQAVGVRAPAVDLKREGEHADPWRLASDDGDIVMGSDLFFDGTVFDPTA
ncbi:MAG: CmpA/NrtA family ABC transporter substrate-binding protein [Deltaproteobacteria bacterium]|nr:CmpA/NrtA family ABC transporter substrate-binding protein [Deltaproteobacteria bacterium]